MKDLKQLIVQLIDDINNSSILTDDIREEHKDIFERTGFEFGCLQQVIDGQEGVELKQEFESVQQQYQFEKERKEKEKELAIQMGTSTISPRVGEVYLLNIDLKNLLEQHGFPASQLNSSLSSNASTSSSSRSSKKKQTITTGKRRFCLVQKVKTDGIEVLPIASFDRQILTKNEDLFTHVLAIDPLPPPPNTKTLKIKLLKSNDKPLHGYVLLIPVFKPKETIWPSPTPVFMDRTQLSYIDSELSKRKFEQQDDDADSEQSINLIPERRGNLFSINDMNKNNQTQEWINEHSSLSIFTDVDENETDQLDQTSFSLHVHPVLHFTNLSPIDIQCSIDVDFPSNNSYPIFNQTIRHGFSNVETIDLKPSELKIFTSDNKHSTLIFTIPYYDNIKWVSEPIDLKVEGKGDYIERLIIFHEAASSDPQPVLRMVLHVDIFHSSCCLLLYSPFWILNRTELQLEIQIENYRTFAEVAEEPFLVCQVKFESEANKKTELEVVETVSDKEQDKWRPINSEEIMPFWPHNVKDGVMRVRYIHNRVTSSPFMMNQKHRTLLRMDDEEHPVIYVEVSATDFDGVTVIFGDYKINDAPLLVVSCLQNDPISFSQVNDVQTQVLSPQNYVYYTWLDSLKPKELIISYGSKKIELELTPQCGFLGKDDDRNVSYTTFIAGIQTVLLFADDAQIIEAASEISSLAESMGQRVQIGIHDIGLSMINDINREEMLYISLNKSEVIRTETKRSLVQPCVTHEAMTHKAMGFFILNRLKERKYAKSDTYVAHITCSESPPSWLMATSKRLLLIIEISFLDLYGIDWQIEYEDLKEEPVIKPNLDQIQILTKEPKKTGTLNSTHSYDRMIKYRKMSDARYIVDKITNAMHTVSL